MIYCVSTQLQYGKGGISTALTGFCESEVLKQHGVHFVTSHAGTQKAQIFYKAAILLANKVGRQDVVWLHCGSWFSILRKFLLAIVPKLKGAKIVFHFHTQTMERYLNHSVYRFLIRLLCGFSDGIVVLTPWWKKRFIQAIPDLEGKIMVIPNPLDKSLIQAASSVNNNNNNSYDGNINLLAMSRLVPGKGFESSIKALCHLPEHYTLTIAGDGPLLNTLKSLSVDLGVNQRVKFIGWVNYQQKKAVFEAHHIFLLPSSFDSFGMGFVEAMAYGLPVVALNFQATPDVVIHNQTGILCDSDDALELATAVEHCSEKRLEMCSKCKEHVLAAFSNESIAKDAISFFKDL